MAKAIVARTAEQRIAFMPMKPLSGFAGQLKKAKKVEILSNRAGGPEKTLDDGTSYDQLCVMIHAGQDVYLQRGVHFGKSGAKLESEKARIVNGMRSDTRGPLVCDAGHVRFKLAPLGTQLDFGAGPVSVPDDMILLFSTVGESEAEAFRNANGLAIDEDGNLIQVETAKA